MKRDINTALYMMKKFFRKHFLLMTAVKVTVKLIVFFCFYN
jgi:hypothetical protein